MDVPWYVRPLVRPLVDAVPYMAGLDITEIHFDRVAGISRLEL